jgi:hypothetical protein
MGRRRNYEADDKTFPADAYRVRGWGAGIAFRVRGWETEPDEDIGCENRTGMIVVVMVGDDAQHIVDPEDVTPLKREEYCGECGQIGCGHDGLDRSEA